MSALPDDTRAWLAATGFTVRDEAMWRMALTHGSTGEADNYERLEWLGDRVLGLSISHWLFANSDAAEGQETKRALSAPIRRPDRISTIPARPATPPGGREGRGSRHRSGASAHSPSR